MVLVAAAAPAVEIVVSVPADTPRDAKLYLAGSGDALGNWNPSAIELQRRDDGTYATQLDIPPGRLIEYKITQGSWTTVEKGADGQDRDNRRLMLAPGLTGPIFVKVERWSSAEPTTQSSVVGDRRLHELRSEILGSARTLRVWLPENYDREPDRRYPVLYMHDGQNCFDQKTSAFGVEWQIDETVTQLIRDNAIPPLIVVAVDHGGAGRIDEYTYVASGNAVRGGGAARHARFLLEEVIPFIETNYRAQEGQSGRFIGGSSLGGLNSLEIARRHPDMFRGVIAMSPSLWWNDGSLLNELSRDAGALGQCRVWIDMGTREGEEPGATKNVELVRRLDEILSARKITHRLLVAPEARHDESAWAARFPDAIRFIVQPNPNGE